MFVLFVTGFLVAGWLVDWMGNRFLVAGLMCSWVWVSECSDRSFGRLDAGGWWNGGFMMAGWVGWFGCFRDR